MFYMPKPSTEIPKDQILLPNHASGQVVKSSEESDSLNANNLLDHEHQNAMFRQKLESGYNLQETNLQPPLIVDNSAALDSLKAQLAQKDEALTLKEYELKEKDLAVKQLKSQLFDKECKLRDLTSQMKSKQSLLEEKEQELRKTEEMFKEYGAWRSKLETIETKMREEASHWKTAAENLQRENTKLQKEALKMTQEIMERVKLIKSKDETIAKLQQLSTVEEAICQNCKNSLEESFIASARNPPATKEQAQPAAVQQQPQPVVDEETIQARAKQIATEQLANLTEKLSMLERQVCMYKERISYHESVEEEHKKNLEQQVDVILKMEEERLQLLREHKASAEKLEQMDKTRDEWQAEKMDLTSKNENLVKQVGLFETELATLRDEVKSCKEQMV